MIITIPILKKILSLKFSMDYIGFFGYEQKQTYSLKKLETLTMVYKKHLLLKAIIICIFIFSVIKNTNANIIYDKGDLLITEIELDEFISLYFEKKNLKLSKSVAIKKLILQKKL